MAQVAPPAVPAAIAAGAAAPGQPALLPAPPAPTTYRERFASKGDLYAGNASPFLHAHRPEAALAPAVVMQTALTLHDDIPDVYAYQDHDTGAIRTVHRISTTASIPGVPSAWDGIVFAFEGDVMAGARINLVQMPAQPFHLTNAVHAPTADALNAHWANLAVGAAFVGPFQAGDADTTEVVTRRMMPVPYSYVALMHTQILTPRQAWQTVGMQVLADNQGANCQHFVDWLRVACTFRQGGADPATKQPSALTVPLADEALHKEAWNWLIQDLPALAPQSNDNLASQMVATSAAIRQEMALQRLDKEEARLEAKAPKTMTEAYPAMATSLRRLCGVPTDDVLPLFWRILASLGGKKHQALAALQQLVTERANEPESARKTIVVSVALFECVSQFRLGAEVDNIMDGVSPFLVVPTTYYKAAATRIECNNYSMLTEGGNTASLNEIRQLSDTKMNVPQDPLQLMSFVGGYSVFVDVIFGVDHAAAVRLREHYSFWEDMAPRLVGAVLPTELPGICTLIMRSIQLTTIGYINRAQRVGVNDAGPSYQYIEDAANNRTWQNLSQLPPRYLEETTKSKPSAPAVPTPTWSATSATSTITTASGTERTNTRVDASDNQKVAAWHSRFAASAKTVTELKANTDRPTTVQGNHKLCLSFHLRGTCFDNCGDKATHRTLAPPEHKAMDAFLDKQL